MPNEKHPPGSFPTIKLSKLAHQLMSNLVEAALLTERAIGEQQTALAASVRYVESSRAFELRAR